MRAVFSIVSLVVVLAIVGVLAKKQLTAGVAPTASGAPAAHPANLRVRCRSPRYASHEPHWRGHDRRGR